MRRKDVEWNMTGAGNMAGVPAPAIYVNVLMDIRDELKQLNALLACRNFTSIPAMLRGIRKNTEKRRTKNGR